MNKAIFGILVALTMIAASAMVLGVSIDEDCKDSFGDDYFGIVKFEWERTSFSKEDPEISPYTVTLTCVETKEDEETDCIEADWTSTPDTESVIVKAGTEEETYSGGSSGTVYDIENKAISHVVFCGYEEEEDPVCGDGIIEGDEECDDEKDNGVACNPLCESSCNYCSSKCEIKTVTGGTCGGGGGGDNEVPVFPGFTVGLAVIGAGLGLALLRKQN
jgi:hypothetical protein